MFSSLYVIKVSNTILLLFPEEFLFKRLGHKVYQQKFFWLFVCLRNSSSFFFEGAFYDTEFQVASFIVLFFNLSTNMGLHSLLVCRVSDEKPPCNSLSLCISQAFLFPSVFSLCVDFLLLDCDMLKCGFLFLCHVLYSLSLLNPWFDITNFGKFVLCYLKYSLYSSVFSLIF